MNQAPLRLAYLVDNPYPFAGNFGGGIGHFVADLARALAARGHVVWVVAPAPDGATGDGPTADGVRTFFVRAGAGWTAEDCGGPRRALLLGHWRLSRALRALARRERLDLVETYDHMGPAAFFHLPTRAACPLVVRLHGAQAAYARMTGGRVSPLVGWLERRTLAAADRVVAVSRGILEVTRAATGLALAGAEVIHNFVDARRFAPPAGIEEDPGLILYVGTLNRNKGLPELFAALPAIFAARPTARLELVGPDSAQGPGGSSFFAALAAGLPEGLRARVVHRGPLPHEALPALYARAAICVFPSLAEAFGIVVLEALAGGAAVVASSRCAHREIIEDGVSGLLCDPRDPAALAGAILRLLNEPELAARLRAGGCARVAATFDIGPAVERNLAFYATLRAPLDRGTGAEPAG